MLIFSGFELIREMADDGYPSAFDLIPTDCRSNLVQRFAWVIGAEKGVQYPSEEPQMSSIFLWVVEMEK